MRLETEPVVYRDGDARLHGFLAIDSPGTRNRRPAPHTEFQTLPTRRLSCFFEFFFVVPSRRGAFATVFARKIHFVGAFRISDS